MFESDLAVAGATPASKTAPPASERNAMGAWVAAFAIVTLDIEASVAEA